MLDIAIKYQSQLKSKFLSIWFDDKYKFFNYDMYYRDKDLDTETWNRHQFVSLNSEGEVIGYIGYSVCRQTYNAVSLSIINFSNNKIVFAKDLKQALTDIFEKFNFNKLNFSVVIGNPIEKSYDKICQKYGGRIVGIYKNETKLFDNQFYDVKHYEILREDYLNSKKNLLRSVI